MAVDLFDPAVQEDWYPAYRELRDHHPVYQMPGTNIFVISRYEDVVHVLRHQDIFPNGTSRRHSPAVAEVWARHGREPFTPLSTNPPVHRQYRRLVDHFFNGDGLDQWSDTIAATIDDLLAEFEHDGSVEFVEQFALPLPVRMITHILGFPADDIEQLKAWSEAWVLPFSGPLSDDTAVWVAEQVMEFHDYIEGHIAEKRAEPDDSVLSQLTTAQFAGERPLTDAEITTIIDHLYIGGNETTTFALTSAIWILLREDGLYEKLLADRALVPKFVEEVLRLESPTQGLYRRVARETEMHGVVLPEDATVHIRYAAANRDERMFDCPHQVDLERSNLRRHMAFSLGEHNCPGSGLSRLEQRMALTAVLERLPNLRFADGRNDFSHHPGFVLRALNELHLDFGRFEQ